MLRYMKRAVVKTRAIIRVRKKPSLRRFRRAVIPKRNRKNLKRKRKNPRRKSAKNAKNLK